MEERKAGESTGRYTARILDERHAVWEEKTTTSLMRYAINIDTVFILAERHNQLASQMASLENVRDVINQLTPLAEQKNADAQFELGLAYCEDGAAKDYKQAQNWFKKAAKQGIVEAQYNLGLCLIFEDKLFSMGPEYWIEKAAKKGFTQAQYCLGVFHATGMTLKKSVHFPKALKWWKKAAKVGHAEAQYTLGIYFNAMRDQPKKAAPWFVLAANQGHAVAQEKLNDLRAEHKNIKV